jgi:hypothetical protein
METQAFYQTRQFVSECPLPEAPGNAVFAAAYLVTDPEVCSPEDVKRAAADLIRAAGLPLMGLAASVSIMRCGTRSFHLMAYDRDGERNPLDVPTVSLIAYALNELLTKLATALAAWATKAGLVEAPAFQMSAAGPNCVLPYYAESAA